MPPPPPPSILLPFGSQGEGGKRDMAMAVRGAIFAVAVVSLLLTLVAAHDPTSFAYSGSNGPDKWGDLCTDYKTCSTGKQQSPINIEKKKLVLNSSLKSLDRDYEPANATLINTGFNILLQFEEGAGTITIDEKKYSLQQLHWHMPAEHTIDGEKFPLELHLVHQSDDGSTTVVGILYKYGGEDPLLDDLKDKLDELAKDSCSEDEEAHVAAGVVDPKSLRRHTRRYYRYEGSFSAPPCTENVVWNILGKVRTVSKEQVAALQAPLGSAFQNNSRPTQSLNGRTVQVYDEAKA